MAELAPGTVFAGHRIEDVAGQGGMGTVYRATHLALDHLVALKVIAPSLASDEGFRERFRSESRIAASLRHPNIVPIHHAGEEDGLLFVTMDLINGPDLRALISGRGPLEPEEAVSVLEQVASALDEAHGRGLVHRDVKPANVLIELRAGADHAYLTDFGLTKRTDQATMSGGGLTSTGAFVGTLDYVAPEQIRAERLDARTDVYALGCLFYEMLAGTAPFADRLENVAKIYAHLTDSPPELPAVISAPEGFDEAIGRAIAKEPDERYPSAGDFARAARAALEGEAVLERERNVGVGSAAPTVEAVTPVEATTAIETPPAPMLPMVEPPLGPTLGTEVPGPPTEANVLPLPDGHVEDETEVVGTPTEATRATARNVASSDPRWGRILPVLGLVAAAVVVGALLLTGGDGDPQGGDLVGSKENGGNEGAGPDGGGDAKPEIVGDPIPVEGGLPVGMASDGDSVFAVSRAGGFLVNVTDGGSVVAETGGRPEEVAVVDSNAWMTLTLGPNVAVVPVEGDEPTLIPTNGSQSRGIVAGGGRVYVANAGSNSVTSFASDPAAPDPVVQTVAVVEPHGLSLGGDALWVTSRTDGVLLELDPGDLSEIGRYSVGANPKGVLWDDDRAWVANTDDDSISVIEDDKESEPVAICDSPRAFASAFGSIWLTCGEEGVVLELDPATREVRSRTRIDGPGVSPEDIVATGDRLWVSTGKGGTVVEIDPAPDVG